MGLDDFTSDDSDETSKRIKTRKKAKNVKLDRRFWEIVVTSDPAYFELAASFTDESSTKSLIQVMNDALEDNISGIVVGDAQAEEIRKIKHEMIEEHL